MARVNYIPYEYGKDPLTKRILDLEREDPMQKRMNGATLLEGRAEEIHQVVLAKIQDYFPKLERQCFEKMETDGLGCLLKDAREVHHPLINRMVTRLLRSSQFDYFRTHNIQEGISVTPEDFLANVIAHEYGHIALDEFLYPKMSPSSYGNDHIFKPLRNLRTFSSWSKERENDEAFAYWFGDSVSQTKSKIDNLVPQGDAIDSSRFRRIYEDLASLSVEQGVSYVLNPVILAEILDVKATCIK